MAPDKPKTPRPLRRDDYRRIGFPRYPRDSYLTPRLREQRLQDAIGFLAHLTRDTNDED